LPEVVKVSQQTEAQDGNTKYKEAQEYCSLHQLLLGVFVDSKNSLNFNT